MSNVHLVELEHKNFKAIVPWTFAIPAPHLLRIMCEKDPIMSFTLTLYAFRDLVAPDKVEELDQLDINDLEKIISQWLSKTTELKEQEDKEKPTTNE